MSKATATSRDVGCLAPVWAQGRLTVFPGTLQALCLHEPNARHDREPPPVPTRLAVAVLEDHIASLDDALNYARISGGPAEVARLERTRAELFASYSQLRYAERVSANF